MYDIAIIGAGPAGATLARLLGGQYKLLLVEKRRLDGPAESVPAKCCGGLLAPDAQRMISRFGLGLPKRVLVEPQLFVVRAVDVPRRTARYYQRYYINMDRLDFDRWLLSLVSPQVDVRLGCRLKACQPNDGHFGLTLAENGRTCAETARVVVGADGAASRVRELAAPAQPAAPAYVAVQEWVESQGNQPYFSALFDPEITDYYGWTIPKGEHLLIGAAMPPGAPAARRFELFKERLRGLGVCLGQTVRREAALLRRPRSARQLCAAQRGLALVGEAGAWISPSSAEGLSYAFRTALALSEAMQPGLDGFEQRYRRETRRLAWNIRLKNWKARLIFHPALRAIAMRSGLHSVDVYASKTALPRPR